MSLMYGRNPSYGSYGAYRRPGRAAWPKAGRRFFGGFFKKNAQRKLYSRSFSGSHVSVADRRAETVRKSAAGVAAGLALTGRAALAGGDFMKGALQGAAQALKSGERKKVRFEFGPGTVMVGLLLACALLGCAYLAHFNLVATRGYEVTRLQADREQLLNQYEIKNMKLAQVRSLANIAATEYVSAMRKPSSVEFVRGDSAIALK